MSQDVTRLFVLTSRVTGKWASPHAQELAQSTRLKRHHCLLEDLAVSLGGDGRKPKT
jgi:hypothetical protein